MWGQWGESHFKFPPGLPDPDSGGDPPLVPSGQTCPQVSTLQPWPSTTLPCLSPWSVLSTLNLRLLGVAADSDDNGQEATARHGDSSAPEPQSPNPRCLRDDGLWTRFVSQDGRGARRVRCSRRKEPRGSSKAAGSATMVQHPQHWIHVEASGTRCLGPRTYLRELQAPPWKENASFKPRPQSPSESAFADFPRACLTPPRVKSISSEPPLPQHLRAPPGLAVELPAQDGRLCLSARHPLGHFRRLPGAGAAHKRGLYLNLTFFVSPLHMNIYREEGPASTPAAPFTESINNSFVKPDLGTED
ncbi:hypothetical protein R6Z07M_005531 [Ovis aries]